MASQQASWADGPFPLVSTKGWKPADSDDHASGFLALEMASAHNLIIRGLNSIYLQGPFVRQEQDVTDYLFFCKAWVAILHHHHEAEEEYLFPGFQALAGNKDIMAINVEQHAAFHDGLNRFEAYALHTEPRKYSWPDLKAIIDSFATPLISHLNSEIPTILAMRQYDDKEVRKVGAATLKFAINTDGDGVAEMRLPLILGCIDRTFEDGLDKNFPPVPFFVPWLVNYWISRKHKGAWRFLPCDFFRNPRPLAFTAATAG